ncbi:hypothetical protein [Reichenbachiella sp. 5M10]|uniref:hypothetical protein n=1 Tax=Reichenbachiella sp. 5M10 TaxID=1889772 RepID=UPI00117BD2C7|nr:hypothetical protein [Reichenbachiella sp. 5M10]
MCTQWAYAQWRLEKRVEWLDVDRFDLNNRGEVYVTRSNGDLAKFDANGQLMLEYSPRLSNKVHQVDFNSQFRVYLFYRDFQEVIILNRYLSEPVRYLFSDFGIGYVSDIAPDMQQNIWLVDMHDFSLKLFDPRRSALVEVKSLGKILNQNTAQIEELKNHQNRTYLMDASQGVLVFDNLGNYLNTMLFDEVSSWGFFKDEIYCMQYDKLLFTNLYTFRTRQIEMPKERGLGVRYFGDRLYVFDVKGFRIYQYLSGHN